MQAQKFIIRGGKRLKGSLRVNGAKNSALTLLAASVLAREAVTIANLPHIEDVFRILDLLKKLGVSVEQDNERTVRLTASSLATTALDPEIAKCIRASIVLTGPVLSRCGEVLFPHPGGCVIGERPIDVFLRGFEALGATVEELPNLYRVHARDGLRGAKIFFPVVSVTGTETLLMAAVLARGTTVLANAAMEPEVVALADFLNTCGAHITGQGTPYITVEGVEEISGGASEVIPDRIEAGSFALLAAATQSRLTMEHCNSAHLDALVTMLQDAGAHVEIGESHMMVDATSGNLKARSLVTHEYPGFPTDLQAPAVVLLTQAEGESKAHETIFEGRLNWVSELVRMGARVTVADPHRILVHGPTPLHGRSIESPDIRAGMAFIIAGLVAEGETELHNIYQIDRGYERIEERLREVGADIQRVTA